MTFAPGVVVLAHLIDVMRNVALLNHHPFFQGDLTDAWMDYAVVPLVIGKRAEQFVGRFAEMKDDVERFASTLIEIAERFCPTLAVKFEHLTARLGDEATTAHVGAGLRVGEMNDDIVNAPAIVTRLVAPHFFWKLA